MSRPRILTSLAGLAAAALAVPAFAAAPTAQAPSSSPTTVAAYTGSPQDEAATKAYRRTGSSPAARGQSRLRG
ncbi:hypothetical protein EV644_10582 [Kribbella orskensis]|uniref:Uncharacterized protein n=1 Tax=Kribbella orskensis TaxID=2512216 RepID=A0ABY2BKX0_9ACTN|nr:MULTISPECIES: hypothetical protein [Kribbella]TCN40799.1 hypothetical protein EV642_10482 [Kribbella sp. VKM Ac-2500]TCO24051.1 hypothetical protein EV644_10582 [Kribbella orskensis]